MRGTGPHFVIKEHSPCKQFVLLEASRSPTTAFPRARPDPLSFIKNTHCVPRLVSLLLCLVGESARISFDAKSLSRIRKGKMAKHRQSEKQMSVDGSKEKGDAEAHKPSQQEYLAENETSEEITVYAPPFTGEVRYGRSIYDWWDPSSSEQEIIEGWWQQFQAKENAPLYGMILADTSDEEVAACAQNYRAELEAISGSKCCFLYFRDLVRAKSLLPFDYAEHAQRVYPLAQLMGVHMKHFPCFVFFTKIDSGKYLCISLANRSQQEMIALARQIFDHIDMSKNANALTQLRTFKHVQALRVTKRALFQNAVEIGKETLIEVLKSLLTIQ
jgi:hypothetical protein